MTAEIPITNPPTMPTMNVAQTAKNKPTNTVSMAGPTVVISSPPIDPDGVTAAGASEVEEPALLVADAAHASWCGRLVATTTFVDVGKGDVGREQVA